MLVGTECFTNIGKLNLTMVTIYTKKTLVVNLVKLLGAYILRHLARSSLLN
jgi:hypothetical protein